jgi:hypothetical protein
VRRRGTEPLWVAGQGRFATVSRCRGLVTVVYHETLEAAQFTDAWLAKVGCGHGCHRDHELVEHRRLAAVS